MGELKNNCPHGWGIYYCNIPPRSLPPECDFGRGAGSVRRLDEELSRDGEGSIGSRNTLEDNTKEGGGSGKGREQHQSDMLSEALSRWEALAGKVENRPARESRRRQRGFHREEQQFIYTGEWRHNQREGLGALKLSGTRPPPPTVMTAVVVVTSPPR